MQRNACECPQPEPFSSPMYVLLSFHRQQEYWQLYGSLLWRSMCWNESFRDLISLCEGQQSMEAIWDIVNRQTASAHTIAENWKYAGDLPLTVLFLVVSPSIQWRAEVNRWELVFVILPLCWQDCTRFCISTTLTTAFTFVYSTYRIITEHWTPLLFLLPGEKRFWCSFCKGVKASLSYIIRNSNHCYNCFSSEKKLMFLVYYIKAISRCSISVPECICSSI